MFSQLSTNTGRKSLETCASLAVRLRLRIGELGDIEAWHVTKRRANNIEDALAGSVRRIALKMLQDVGEGVGDASVREYRGGAFREDRRPILVYLIPTSDRDDAIARLDREVGKMDRENEDLRQLLREAHRDRESGNTFARATPTASLERVKAVRMGADILEAPGLRNVRRGSTLTDDNERHLVPAR